MARNVSFTHPFIQEILIMLGFVGGFLFVFVKVGHWVTEENKRKK